ncbi:ATP-dependent DNA helicase RecG [Luteococcus japonicus]|uniref:ATP-dependent DNA helicase RecG n=1 Tax=Luteococcus japonicus TaxID=33984 RepID=A0A3N1ZQS2_9ACTN|nr:MULTISPECIES: OB-fold nucleic acid binding domain-containing protein [Luteococcus]MDN5563449.1 OB-fold nucleic acid binding domain-containing protein [Luteococcus sp.]ROR53249.1 ATP-dependent DNA helicase RecG [Luteococcus japonicus]
MSRTASTSAERSRRGALGRLVRRFTTTEGQTQAEAMQEEAMSAGCASLSHCRMREQVRVRGVISQVTLNPRGVNRWLEAILDDGSGEVTLIWMGRRIVRGIEPGRKLEVEGRLTLFEGRPTIYNPKYSLLNL